MGMATLPIFITHIQCLVAELGCHAKKMKGYPEEPRTTGEHLRRRRLDLRQGQEPTAAQKFGISVTAYNAWECDRHEPDIKHWPEIISFLGYDPTPTPSNLDAALTALQRRHGLDRERLAVRLGIERKTLFNWLRGKTAPLPALRRRVLASDLPGAELLQPFI